MSSFSRVSPDLVDEAVELCRGAGAILRDAYERHDEIAVDHKGPVDLVTDADRASEAYLLKCIHKRFPGHAVWAEESGKSGPSGPWRWIIDPLDGTVNFAHRMPHFSVILALQQESPQGYETVLGVILDPLRGELFVAIRGEGA